MLRVPVVLHLQEAVVHRVYTYEDDVKSLTYVVNNISCIVYRKCYAPIPQASRTRAASTIGITIGITLGFKNRGSALASMSVLTPRVSQVFFIHSPGTAWL